MLAAKRSMYSSSTLRNAGLGPRIRVSCKQQHCLTIYYLHVRSAGLYTRGDAVIAATRAFKFSMDVFQALQAAIHDLSCRLDAVQTYVAEAIG